MNTCDPYALPIMGTQALIRWVYCAFGCARRYWPAHIFASGRVPCDDRPFPPAVADGVDLPGWALGYGARFWLWSFDQRGDDRIAPGGTTPCDADGPSNPHSIYGSNRKPGI